MNRYLILICVFLVSGCGDDPENALDVVEIPENYLVVSTASVDFQTATYGLLDLESFEAFEDYSSLQADSMVTTSGGLLFGINRLGADNIQRIDPATALTIWQYSTGAGSNPQSIEVVSEDKAYVTLYESNELLIVNPTARAEGEFIVGSVDLSAFADDDGVVEAHSMAVVGDRLFVALQRVDRDDGFRANNASYLVAIDTSSDQIVDLTTDRPEFVLPYPNPQAIRVDGASLWVLSVGYYGEQDGALIAIDTSDMSHEVVLLESEAGGDINMFEGFGPIFMLVADGEFETSLMSYDPTTTEVVTFAEDLGFVVDLAATDELLFVPDRNLEAPGIRVFETAAGVEVTSAPISVGLPPWSLAIVNR